MGLEPPASHSRKPSTASQKTEKSRTSSLVFKNTQPHDTTPADVLVERFTTWKDVVKQLIAYFEGIYDIESRTAKEFTKLSTVIQVPLPAASMFLEKGGIQDILQNIRDKTHAVADEHMSLAKTLDGSIIQHLQTVKAQIKSHIKNIQNDTGRLSTSVAKERETSEKLLKELACSITGLEQTPMDITSKTDPYVVNTSVRRQLSKQVQGENALQRSTITMQQNAAIFESTLVRDIQSTWKTFEDAQSRLSSSTQQTWKVVAKAMHNLVPDREWNYFSKHDKHLLDPETPLRDPEAITYPQQDEDSILPVRKGHLERKTKYTGTYKESYFVLTAAGFLHEFTSSDLQSADGNMPVFSLFLPTCGLGPPSSTSAKSAKFTIDGKDGMSSKTGSLRILKRNKERAWIFRSQSRATMMEWWNAIRPFCTIDPLTGKQKDMSGPVAAAVRSAGYKSGDEDSTDEDDVKATKEDEEDEEPPGYLPRDDAGGTSAEKESPTQTDKKKASGWGIRRASSKRQAEKSPSVPHVKFKDKPQ